LSPAVEALLLFDNQGEAGYPPSGSVSLEVCGFSKSTDQEGRLLGRYRMASGQPDPVAPAQEGMFKTIRSIATVSL